MAADSTAPFFTYEAREHLAQQEMLHPTNASRLKEFDASIALETERQNGAVLSAAMGHDAASFSRHQAQKQAKVNRAARMQILKDKRSSGQTAALFERKVYTPNTRGGKSTLSKCSKCGMLKEALIQRVDTLTKMPLLKRNCNLGM